MQGQFKSNYFSAGASLLALLLVTSAGAGSAQAQVRAQEMVESGQGAPAGDDAEAGSFFDNILAMVGIGAAGEDEAVDAADLAPNATEADAATELNRAVELIQPGAEQTVLQRNFFGRVVARETADLAFSLNGTLERFPVDEGAVVQAGTLLAQLDLAPFERAVERATIQLDRAERALARATRLADQGVGAATAAEDAQSARDLADVALREARDALEDATILAPYRALIAERSTANHVIVEPGMPIVRVHDISQMRVEIDIPERLVQRFSVSTQVTFHADLPGQSGLAELPVVEFQAQTEAVGQSYRFSLALPDGAAANLLPGSSLTVTAELPKPAPSLILPPTAIAADDDRQPYVLVFEPAGAAEGTVRAHPVEVLSVDGTSFAVSGLPTGSEIVETGAHLLRDGQSVRRFTSLKVEE